MESNEIFRLMDLWHEGEYDQVATEIQLIHRKDLAIFMYYLGHFYGIEEIRTLSKFIDFE